MSKDRACRKKIHGAIRASGSPPQRESTGKTLGSLGTRPSKPAGFSVAAGSPKEWKLSSSEHDRESSQFLFGQGDDWPTHRRLPAEGRGTTPLVLPKPQ